MILQLFNRFIRPNLIVYFCYNYRHSLKFQYSALDSGSGQNDRSPRERAARERALCACQEWLKTLNGRYEIIAHLDDIGSRNNKNWFLLNDTTVRGLTKRDCQ